MSDAPTSETNRRRVRQSTGHEWLVDYVLAEKMEHAIRQTLKDHAASHHMLTPSSKAMLEEALKA